MHPEEVLKIEFQRVHRVGKTNVDGKAESDNSEVSAFNIKIENLSFLRRVFRLKDSQFGISAD